MEAANRPDALAEIEWQLVNATMVQARTHVPGAATAGRKLPLSDRLRQFGKFCLVGGSGTLVDMGVLYVLADPKMLAFNLALGKVCAAEIALINNFLWNEFWTFRSPNNLSPSDGERARVRGFDFGSPRLRRLLFFNAICGLGIVFAVLLLHLFHMRLGWNLYVSNLLTIGLVTVWNFGMNAGFDWRRQP
jgi:dolichol-phosphate mannosyltransferase